MCIALTIINYAVLVIIKLIFLTKDNKKWRVIRSFFDIFKRWYKIN